MASDVTLDHMAAHATPWYTRHMIDNMKKRLKCSNDEDVIAMLTYIGKLEYRLAKERERVRLLNTRLEDIVAIGN